MRYILQKAKLLNGFWAEALLYSNYLKNLLPIIKGVSLFKWINNKKPFLDVKRIFGLLCKVYIPKEHRTKLDPIAINGIYLEIYLTIQCKVYILKRQKIETYTNIKVFKNKLATHLL